MTERPVECLEPRPLDRSALDHLTWHERIELCVPGLVWVLPSGHHVAYRVVLVIDGVGHGLALVDGQWVAIQEPVPDAEADESRIEAVDAIHDRLEKRVDPPEEAILETVWSIRREFPEVNG